MAVEKVFAGLGVSLKGGRDGVIGTLRSVSKVSIESAFPRTQLLSVLIYKVVVYTIDLS